MAGLPTGNVRRYFWHRLRRCHSRWRRRHNLGALHRRGCGGGRHGCRRGGCAHRARRVMGGRGVLRWWGGHGLARWRQRLRLELRRSWGLSRRRRGRLLLLALPGRRLAGICERDGRRSAVVREVAAGCGAADLPGCGVVGARCLRRGVERAQPAAGPDGGVANLGRPLAPWPLPHAAESLHFSLLAEQAGQ